MSLPPQEPTAFPSRRSLREAQYAQERQAETPDPLTGLLLTPLPEFIPGSAADSTSQHPSTQASPQNAPRRSAKKLVAATFSLACVTTLAMSTTLPAFSSGLDSDETAAARAAQELHSSQATGTHDALDAIGSVELGVDPGSYKQITPEAGLVEPASLDNTDIRMPFDRDYPLTDGFAYRTAPVEQFHDAQDIAAPGGTPVLAIGSGVVIEAGYVSDGCGFSIKLQHKVSDETLTSRYCHMQVDSHDHKVGDTVESGDFIGRVGNTGMSFGDHLHLALRRSGVPIDPLPYIADQMEKAAKRAAVAAKN